MNKDIKGHFEKQKQFFQSGKTKDITYRITALKKLKRMLVDAEGDLIQALARDLGKPSFEAYTSEIYICLQEINLMLNHIYTWSACKKVKTPFYFFGSTSYIQPEPFGITLIIAPWNFPIQLLLMPLIGALAAGNCALLKPSEYAPHTSQLIHTLITATFPEELVMVIEGGIPESEELLSLPFDYIFFTGSSPVGKIVMQAAAQHLTPLTLELGGKNPCIVDKKVNLKKAAQRIVWGKFYNGGQNCLSPDYLLVEKSIKEPLINYMQTYIKQFYGEKHYFKIVNLKHFERLSSLLTQGRIRTGGQVDKEQLYIAPTILDNVSLNDAIMQEEIFGPLLPIYEYTDIGKAITVVNERPKPLAVYLFSDDTKIQQLVKIATSSGSIGINDTLIQSTNPNLPFGGIGNSGFGSYHGKASFDTFSHYKSIFVSSKNNAILRYPPYGKIQHYLQFILRWLAK